MKFYNRKNELDALSKIYDLSLRLSHMVVITGRRRIGKTELIKQFAKRKNNVIYLFVSKKKTGVLLEEFRDILSLKIPFLKNVVFNNFDDFFSFIFDYMKENHTLIVIDEFQNFQSVDPSIFSIFQKHWDLKKNDIKGAFILIGSVFTAMRKIFEGEKEPLMGRATAKFYIEPLKPHSIIEILKDHKVDTSADILFYYTLFGGVPKYYFLLDRYELFGKHKDEIIKTLFCEQNAVLQNEGRDIFIEEFGKNYTVYFSILQSIASGNTQMVRIADDCGINVNSISKYLDELTSYYGIIERRVPVTEFKNEKIGRYYILDNAVNFWFRYIFKNQSLIEIGDKKTLTDKILNDLNTLMGFKWEQLVKNILKEKNILPFKFIKIGGFWTRKENIEIDITALNETEGKILFGECKLNGNNFTALDIKKFKEKARYVKWKHGKRTEYYALFSFAEIKEEIKIRLKKENILAYDLNSFL